MIIKCKVWSVGYDYIELGENTRPILKLNIDGAVIFDVLQCCHFLQVSWTTSAPATRFGTYWWCSCFTGGMSLHCLSLTTDTHTPALTTSSTLRAECSARRKNPTGIWLTRAGLCITHSFFFLFFFGQVIVF